MSRTTKPRNPHDKTTPVTDYLRAKDNRDNRLWTLYRGTLTTVVNGQKMTAEEFDRAYPVSNAVSFLLCPDNKDGTKAYLL